MRYIGPLDAASTHPPPEWPALLSPTSPSTAHPLPVGTAVRRCFAYVNTPGFLRAVHEAFASLPGWQVLIVAPNLAPHLGPEPPPVTEALASGSTLRVQASFVDAHAALQGADLLVSYGSIGLTGLATSLGVAQVILPTDVEKALTARRLQRQGLAQVVKARPAELADALFDAIRQAAPRVATGVAPFPRTVTG